MATSPGGVEVGRVSVRVLPDTSRLLAELEADLKKVEAGAEIKVGATIDNTRLDAEARAAVDEAQLAAGDINIKAKVDTSQVGEAESVLARATSSAQGFSGGLGAIATAAIVLGPALIPLIAVLGTLGAALVAPLAVAGSGFTLFAVLTGAVIKQTEDQKKKIDQLKASVDAAKQSLVNTQTAASASAAASTASAQASAQAALTSARQALAQATTTAARSSALARIHAAETSLQGRKSAIAASQNRAVSAAQLKVNAAVEAYHKALGQLTPAQSKFLAAQAAVKSAFQHLIVTTGPALLGPVTQVLAVVASIIPAIKPILTVVSNVVSDIVGQFASFAGSPGFKSFVKAFAEQLGPDLRAFAEIAGNGLSGLVGLFGALGQALSGSVLSGLVRLTRQFAAWGQSVGQTKGFRTFVDYVKRVGPQVGKALGAIAAAAGAIVLAFAPVGGVVLVAITGVARAIASIPTEVLTTLATSLVLIVAASKLIGPLSLAFEALTSPIGLAVAAAALLVVAFLALYHQSKPLRTLLGDLGDFFKTQLLPVIQKAAQQVMPAITAAFKDISKSIKDNKPFLETMGKLLLTFASAVIVTGILVIVGAIRVLGKEVAFGIRAWHLFADVVLLLLRGLVAGIHVFVSLVLSSFATIVDGAAAAFGWIPGIGGKIKGAQAAFHEFADNAVAALGRTGDKLKQIQDQIDGIHDKKFKVNIANNNALVAELEALQAFRLHDKSFKIKADSADRVVGPGGGIGLPAGVGDPSSSGRSAPLVNVENMHTADAADILRKSQSLARGRAGGGVILAGSNR